VKRVEEFIATYLGETQKIAEQIDRAVILDAVDMLVSLKRRQGRLFILGVGGSAANASHAANDFRKIAGIEAYAPTDNCSELTAWVNDVSWECVFKEWLRESHLNASDALLILSVGGGSLTTSRNLVLAMEYAKEIGCSTLSIVSRDGGRARELSNVAILIPVLCEERITPHAEGWQAIVWHLLANAMR